MLLIFQGMDAAGKDSAIKSMFDGVNPQGCEVTSFKQPSAHELDHDFLWRSMVALPRARPDRHLQPLLLRGMPGGAGAPGNPRQGKAAAAAGDQEHLARAVRGHLGDGALPGAQRHRDPEVLPQRLQGRTARALPRPAGGAGEELEVLDGRHRRARAVGEVPGRLSGHDPPHLDASRRRGTWCRPTTNGSPAS